MTVKMKGLIKGIENRVNVLGGGGGGITNWLFKNKQCRK